MDPSRASRTAVTVRRLGSVPGRASPGLGIPGIQVSVDVLLADPVAAADAYGRQVPLVDESVDGHLGHTHQLGDLVHGHETSLTERSLGHAERIVTDTTVPRKAHRARSTTPVPPRPWQNRPAMGGSLYLGTSGFA